MANNSAVTSQLNKLKQGPKEGELLPEGSNEGVDVPKFQQYKSARKATRVITPTGGRVNFVNFEFFTQDEAIIEYLDTQIKMHSLPGITRGELMTTDDRDPMAAMRRKMKEELKQEIAQEAQDAALGIKRKMGTTAGASHIAPAGSDTVAG